MIINLRDKPIVSMKVKMGVFPLLPCKVTTFPGQVPSVCGTAIAQLELNALYPAADILMEFLWLTIIVIFMMFRSIFLSSDFVHNFFLEDDIENKGLDCRYGTLLL